MFVFAAAGETGRARTAPRDRGFRPRSDRLDFAASTRQPAAGNQGFKFVAPGFSAALPASLLGGVLSGDLNGDRVADFEIALAGAAVTATDILL